MSLPDVTNEQDGISPLITHPAPIILLSPICAPFNIQQFAAIQTFLPIIIGASLNSFFL